jgi:hypothetical protein
MAASDFIGTSSADRRGGALPVVPDILSRQAADVNVSGARAFGYPKR